MCEYFKDGYFGLADEFSFGFVADYYATNLYYAGVDVKKSQYLLGHSSIEMTLKIIHTWIVNETIKKIQTR